MPSDSQKNSASTGFYARALLPEEAGLYAQVQIGSLDEEVRLAKLKLLRLVQLAGIEELRADEALDDEPDALSDDLSKSRPKTSGRAARREIKPESHYAALLQRQLELVRKLELSRFQMLGKAITEEEVALIVAEPDEDGPDAPL